MAEHSTLRWGDIIRIHGVNHSKAQLQKGLIISKGFTDPNVYYQTYTKFQDVNFYRESLFQLLYRGNFDVHDQLQNLTGNSQQREVLKERAKGEIKALENTLELKAGEPVMYGTDVVFRHVESNSYLRGVMKAADSGDGAFTIEVCEQLSTQVVWKIRSHRSYQHEGDPIYYDDYLQVYHEGLDCFMNFAENNKPIYLDSLVEGNKQEQDALKNSCSGSLQNRPTIKKPLQKRISILNENKSKCLWKFILHCTYSSYIRKENIKSHDIIAFEHTRKKGLISESLCRHNYYLKEISEGKEPVETEQETSSPWHCYDCFWELIPTEVNENGPEKCNDFHARNIISGNLLSFEGFPVSIRPKQQIVGGGFLDKGLVNLICTEDKKMLQRGPLKPRDLTKAKIIQCAEQLYIQYDMVAVKELTEDSFHIVKVSDEAMRDIQYVISAHEPLIKFLEVIMTQIVEQKAEHKRRDRRGSDHTNQAKDAKGDLMNSRNGRLSFQAPSASKKEERKNYDFKKLDEDALGNVKMILQLLTGKIYGTTQESIVSSGNTANRTIQKILVETGVIQLLIEIIYRLYLPFVFIENNSEASDDRAQRVKISDIFERVYKLLEKVVVGNQANKIYLSRWVDLFLKHSNTINREYVQECLVGILQNNAVSIELTIEERKINTLIESFFTEALEMKSGQLTTKYLRLFSTFIKCDNRVLKENQKIILNNFFKNRSNFLSFKFRLQDKEVEESSQIVVQEAPIFKREETDNDPFSKIRTRCVEIALGKQDFSSIPKFFKDWGSKWNYFLAYVDLLADVCMDRNNESIQNVSALVTLPIITTILFDSDLSKLNELIQSENEECLKSKQPLKHVMMDMREPFIRVAHYVYVNNFKFTKIKRIQRISNWHSHQKHSEEAQNALQEEINRTARPFEGEKEEEEHFHLRSMLWYITDLVTNSNQTANQLPILLTVLNLLFITIQLGLWESIEQLRKLIPFLIMRIAKVEDSQYFNADQDSCGRYMMAEIVKHNKESLSRNRPEIAIAINCKIRVTEIFRLINQLEIDIRLRYMMNFFKGIYEATEPFEIYNRCQKQPQIDDVVLAQRNEKAQRIFLAQKDLSLLGNMRLFNQDQQAILKESVWSNKLKELTPSQSDYQQAIDGDHKMGQNRNIAERYLFQNVGCFDDMVLALFELPVYMDERLLGRSLGMLRSIFEQRQDLIKQFQSVIICGQGNLREVYHTLTYMRMKFNMLSELSILTLKSDNDDSFPYAISKAYDPCEKNEAKRSGILQDLFFLSRTMKQDANLRDIGELMHVDERIFEQGHVENILSQKDRNNKLFQSVNLAEGIYIPLLGYAKLIGSSELSETHRRVLFAIYYYLSVLCFNNLEAKQILMAHVPDILPHLSKKVGAATFLYQVSINNKLLIGNLSLVTRIIDAALQACNTLDANSQMTRMKSALLRADPSNAQLYPPESSASYMNLPRIASEDLFNVKINNYEKSQILFSLRGILFLNSEGYRVNQQLLINRFQDNKFKRLIYKDKVDFSARKQNVFGLTPQQSYVACHFELFSVLVQSRNIINIGKLQNIHPYSYCLQCLAGANRLQVRRSLRAYVNRLYYVNKDRDIFIFEQFIRKEFKLINCELEDVLFLHRNKLIHDQLMVPNGIRFKFVESQVFEMVIEIFITLQEMFLKPQFLRVLRAKIVKEARKSDSQREIHEHIIKLLQHLGCFNKLYPGKSIISAFISALYSLLEGVILIFNEKYLEKHSLLEVEANSQLNDDLGVEPERITFNYDYSKSFFQNLYCSIRDVKAQEKKDELKKRMRNKDRMEGSLEERKIKYIRAIFQVPNQRLKQIKPKRFREVSTSIYKPHEQTNNKIYKVAAKNPLTEDEQNIELNRKIGQVKQLMEDSALFRKLKEDEFNRLVDTLTNIDATSRAYYEPLWSQYGEKRSMPVMSLKEIMTKSFSLIMEHPDKFREAEKSFVLKLARCYITEAVEAKQNYKLPVDQWEADYYSGEEGSDCELVKRQNLIEECGGSKLIISIFQEDHTSLASKINLLNETLLLGIAYLYNGNATCQNSVLLALKKDNHNFMLSNIRKLVITLGQLLIEMRKIKENSKPREFAYSIVDTYDHYDFRSNMIHKSIGSGCGDKFEAETENNCDLALRRIYRLMQLFCESGNKEMKWFLLVQTDQLGQKKANSINFIEETTLLLRKLFKVMNDKLVQIPEPLLDFISEITQVPCLENQISFMKSTFFEDISYLGDFFQSPANLQSRNFDASKHEESLTKIYQKGIQLALCNFEGNDDILIWEFLNKCQPKFLWIVIEQNLCVLLEGEPGETIQEKLSKFNRESAQRLIEREQRAAPMFREEICHILSVFYILKRLQAYSHACEQKLLAKKEQTNLELKEKVRKALAFRQELLLHAGETCPSFPHWVSDIESLVLSIQVSSFNGRQEGLQFIYFPKHPVFQYLGNDTRDSIMMRVKRDTQRDKLISLLGERKQVYDEIELNYKLKHSKITFFSASYDFEINSNYANTLRVHAKYVSFLVLLLMTQLILVDYDLEEKTAKFAYGTRLAEWTVRGCCGVQLALTLWYLYIWLRLRLPLALKQYDKHSSKGQQQDSIHQEEFIKDRSELEGWQIIAEYLSGKLKLLKTWCHVSYSALKKQPAIRHTFISFYAIAKYEEDFLSTAMFVGSAICGNFVGVEWYAMHLFAILIGRSELTNIFKAILLNLSKLAILSMLAGVFILVFNVISLNQYTPVIYNEDTSQTDTCYEMLGCVLELYTSQAIGDDMDKFQLFRFFFDTLYVVFMEMLFQNIVGGIIIDAFAGLKEEDEAREEDQKNLCYICSLSKPDMEKSGTTFTKHTQRHFLWNYLYYVYCLEKKSTTDFTGLEYDIDTKRKADDISWFPSNGNNENGIEIEHILQQLEGTVARFGEILDKSVRLTEQTIANALSTINMLTQQTSLRSD